MAKPTEPKPEPPLKLVEDGAGWVAVYREHVYRFLLADGRTADVRAVLDDSWLREAVVAEYGVAIVGVAQLPAGAAEPSPPGDVAPAEHDAGG